MRLPNGYGSVYKLSGNRRKPYIARRTIGWDDNGKQLYANIGYYRTRAEALQALAAFNDNPYDFPRYTSVGGMTHSTMNRTAQPREITVRLINTVPLSMICICQTYARLICRML